MTHNRVGKAGIGSRFNDFLEEQQIRQEVETAAIKSVLSAALVKFMEENKISKIKMAKSLDTSRSALDRLLSPEDTSITISTFVKAVSIMGKRAKIIIEDVENNASEIRR